MVSERGCPRGGFIPCFACSPLLTSCSCCVAMISIERSCPNSHGHHILLTAKALTCYGCSRKRMPSVPLGLLCSHRIGIAGCPYAGMLCLMRFRLLIGMMGCPEPSRKTHHGLKLLKRATFVLPIPVSCLDRVAMCCVGMSCLVWSGLVFVAMCCAVFCFAFGF